MDKDRICKKCKFFDANTLKASYVGSCRYNPPCICISHDTWPYVNEKDWCGKFEYAYLADYYEETAS